MLEQCLALFFPFLMIYAAMSDLVSMTISNKVSLLLIAGFMIFAVMTGMSWELIAWHWSMFAIVLLVGFSLFAFGVIGGGDAKLAASTALWFGWEYILDYIYISSVLGAFLTISIVIFRARTWPLFMERVDWINRLYKPETGVPYGIALGAGALIVYPTTFWMQYVFAAAGTL